MIEALHSKAYFLHISQLIKLRKDPRCLHLLEPLITKGFAMKQSDWDEITVNQ